MDKRNDGELVFAAPSYVGEIAERARRVEELEQNIAKKDEALWLARQALHCLDSCFEKSGDKCVYGGQEKPCKAVKTKDAVIEALSLTPASVAQQVEDARIGRAVREFVTRQKTAVYYRWTTSDYERGYKDAVDAVEIAITKAREAENRG